MDFSFRDDDLERLYHDADFTGNFDKAVVKSFRKKMQVIASANDERDLRQWKSLRYEKLKGKRKHQHSIRLNDQWRLILEKEKTKQGEKLIIVAIEDYHGG